MAKGLDQYYWTGWPALDLSQDYWTAPITMRLATADTVMMLVSVANPVSAYNSVVYISVAVSPLIYPSLKFPVRMEN